MEPPRLNALESRLQPLRAALDRNVSTAGRFHFWPGWMLRVGVHPDPATVPRRGPSPRSHGWYAADRMYTGYVMGEERGVSTFISKSTKRFAQRCHYWCRHAKCRSGKARFNIAGDGCIVGNELLFRIFIRRVLIRRKLPAAICSQTLPIEERIRRREQLYGQLSWGLVLMRRLTISFYPAVRHHRRTPLSAFRHRSKVGKAPNNTASCKDNQSAAG